MGECLKATLSQMQVCKAPVGLQTEALGACVGVAIWDSSAKLGGLVEIMHPYAGDDVGFQDMSKYADSGIQELVRRLVLHGAGEENLTAKIVGGASVSDLQHISGSYRVGAENVMAVKNILHDLGIEIVAEDVGADYSRWFCFYPEDGSCVVTAPGFYQRQI